MFGTGTGIQLLNSVTFSYLLSGMEINEISHIVIKPVDVIVLNLFLKNLQKQCAELMYPGKQTEPHNVPSLAKYMQEACIFPE
jgi:hypothetical protein